MLLLYLASLNTQEEKDKFEQLYNNYRETMFYTAKGILHDNYLAEDATHNAFLRIVNNMDKIDEISCSRTKGFMVVVTRNVAMDLYNRRKRESNISMADVDYKIADKCNVLEDVTQQICVEAIIEKVGLLPHFYEEVLLLKYIYDLNDKEIAQVLDISHATARKRIERGREKMNILCKAEYA